MSTLIIDDLRSIFGDALEFDVPLAPYTSARLGGTADYLVVIQSADELANRIEKLTEIGLPFHILGGGSNVLVSDKGVRNLVLINKARKILFDKETVPPTVFAESGSNFGAIARQAAQKGLSGLEWAAGIPGSVGGALFGNAGAHGGDVASSLKLAEVLQLDKGRSVWPAELFQFSYRSSLLKQKSGQIFVLSAVFNLRHDHPESIKTRMNEFQNKRRKTQPPGASMGSMFKNPAEDYAGRLIEAAGLKGKQIGGAQISDLHANFFLNKGEATADEVYQLIEFTRAEVAQQFGINLELEIELFGDWPNENRNK